MLQFLGDKIYTIIPARFLKWKTGTNIVEKHKLYCEKIIIIIFLLLLYSSIFIVFIYYSWVECTNIIDLIKDKNIKNKTYYTKIFHRNSSYCNTLDGFFVVYIFFLLMTLFLNIVFGIFYNYYRQYKLKSISKDSSEYLEKIIVHIPLYNEDYDTIKSTIDSVCKLNYNLENILLLIVVDGIITNSKTNQTTDFTLLNDVLQHNGCGEEFINYKDNRLKIYNGVYDSVNYSVIVKCGNSTETNKKGNRGKKDSALIIYEIIYYMNKTYMDDAYYSIIDKLQSGLNEKQHFILEYEFMLIIDCDTDIEINGLIILLNYLNTNNKCIAVCGQTIVKNSSENFITNVQSFEYFVSHLLLKAFEHILYKVFVLSGCFALFRLRINGEPTINDNILRKYTKEAKGLYEKNLLDLGEDRHLTVLIIQEYPDKHLSYISDAECYTNVPNTFKMLLKQRQRWTNSLIVCLFLLGLKPPVQSVFRHIKMYLLIMMELFIIFILPLVIIIGLINSITSIAVQGYSLEPVLITVLIIFLNLIITILAGRFDMVLRFFPFFIYLPVFSIAIPLYSIINLDDTTWGITRSHILESNEEPIQEVIEISTPVNAETNYEESV
jgi:cellulose synthase/poly-beta-1,6-N-acetylglucosamine synthase-like glycosyltransferase